MGSIDSDCKIKKNTKNSLTPSKAIAYDNKNHKARVAELADALDLGSSG